MSRAPAWLTRNVVALGLVSLLTDAASEMVVPLLPAFLTGTLLLGSGGLALGLIEGVADAVASVVKLVSGLAADRAEKKRPLVIAGYGLAAIVRPCIALATTLGHVVGLRALDRVGKGLRASPRDALLAGSVPLAHRGAAFGLHRGMDHAGAVVGPLLAIALLSIAEADVRTVFAFSAIPGALAVVVLIAGVREAPAPKSAAPSAHARIDAGALARLLVPLGLFTLGNASDVFLLLKMGATGTEVLAMPLLWMVLHVVKSAASVPGGRLADRIGRQSSLFLGWLLYAGVYAALGLVDNRVAVTALVLAAGLRYGFTEGAERALVAEIVPKARWGTGYGWYHGSMGLLVLGASVIFGVLWDRAGSRTAFLTSAGLALAAAIALRIARPGATSAATSA